MMSVHRSSWATAMPPSNHHNKRSIAIWKGVSLPKACPGGFLLILLIFAEQAASSRACTCCLHRSRLSRSQFSIPAPWLGPGGMHFACKDMMLSPPARSAHLLPASCPLHRSPNPSQRERSEHFSHSIHPHPLHRGFFPQVASQRKALPVLFQPQSVGSGHGAW